MKFEKKYAIQIKKNYILRDNIVEATKKIEAPINHATMRYFIGYIVNEEKKVHKCEVDEETYKYVYDYLKKRYDEVIKKEKEKNRELNKDILGKDISDL